MNTSVTIENGVCVVTLTNRDEPHVDTVTVRFDLAEGSADQVEVTGINGSRLEVDSTFHPELIRAWVNEAWEWAVDAAYAYQDHTEF